MDAKVQLKALRHGAMNNWVPFICIFLLGLTGKATPLTAKDQQPIPVYVDLKIIDISKVDDVEESVSGEFVLIMHWKDPEVLKNLPGEKTAIFMEEINPPVIEIKNLLEMQTFRKGRVEPQPDGTLIFRYHFLGRIKQRFDFRRFPFDKQIFNIQLILANSSMYRMELLSRQNVIVNTNNLNLNGWKVFNDQVYLKKVDSPFDELSWMTFSCELRRDPNFHIWKILFPILLIVMMSWSVFWIDPKNIGAQLSVSVTAILTLIAFQFSVAQLIPPLPYLTLLDRFTIGADIFVFLAFIEAVLTSYLQNKGKHHISVRTDHWSKFIFPLSFLIFLAILLLRHH